MTTTTRITTRPITTLDEPEQEFREDLASQPGSRTPRRRDVAAP